MLTTSEQVDLWRQAPTEHQRLEFKEAKNQFDMRKLGEYCVALANEGGGVVLLGVADQPPRAVVGTQAFQDTVQTAERLFHSVGFRVDVEAVMHPDGRVVVFHIPSRPRGTAFHLDGKYLMRAGEALVPMTEDQLRRIFSEGQPDWLEQPSRSGLDAQQVVELLDAQTFFELLRLPYPTDRVGVLERLARERMIDVSGDTFVVRRLGALTLARRLADVMRRVGICEEKSSGVDRVVQAAEGHHLPAPDFRSGFRRTSAIVSGPKSFDEMDRSDRVRACYQHCALKWVTLQPMMNQSLRTRFHLSENKAAAVSQVIAATLEARLIKPDSNVRGSRRFARYQPFWG